MPSPSYTQGSLATVGLFRLWFLPSSVTNPLSVGALQATSAKDFTYSLAPGGWRPSPAENSVSDGRFTQRQVLSRKGNFTFGLELQYVYGAVDDIAYVTFVEDVAGFIVVREGVANETDLAVGQLVDLFTFKAGKQRKDPPAENALKTITQGLSLTAPNKVDQALVA